MPQRPRILVVYKKSAFQLYTERKEPKVRALIARGARHAQVLEKSHTHHNAALETVVAACRATGADVRRIYRAHLRDTTQADLVVTVGGDGTVLDASHRVLHTTVLGVNSNPTRSVGYLTAATAATFGDILEGVLSGTITPLRLLRLAVHINGELLPTPVVNDVLFCHANPAATSRYMLHAARSREEQKSSGLWIAAPAGSTAAVLSAGGTRDAMEARRFQYRVREPYAPPGQVVRLVGGFVPQRGRLSITSHLRDAAVFLDGAHLKHAVGMGDEVTITSHPAVLRLVRPRRD